jgi:hypothetical protein
MQPVRSTRLSSTSSSRDLYDDTTCTTHHHSASFEANWETLARLAFMWKKPLDLDVCPTPSSSYRFCGATDKPSPAWFWGSTKKLSQWFWGLNHQTAAAGFEVQTEKPTNLDFEAQPRNPPILVLRLNQEIRQPWFWGSTKKSTLLISLWMVQTAHGVTWPPDHLATEYSTCAWPSLILCTRSPTPVSIFVTAHHVAPIIYTSRDKQMWFSTQTNMDRTTETSRIQLQTVASQWLITIKPRY